MITVPRNKVAIRFIQDRTTTPSGIYTGESERSDQGIVKYIGADVTFIRPGDYVLFSGWSGSVVHIEGEGGLIFLLEDAIECILHPPTTEIAGLFHVDQNGEYFPATYESTIEMIRDQYDYLPRFANLKNRRPPKV